MVDLEELDWFWREMICLTVFAVRWTATVSVSGECGWWGTIVLGFSYFQVCDGFALVLV